MSRDTERLIERLALEAVPVRPLASPLRRTLAWLATSIALAALLLVLYGWRGGLPAEFAQPGGGMAWWGSVLTGVAAAYALFQISVPGRAPGWAWLPALPAALWLAGMGWGCLAEARAGGLVFGLRSWHCALVITLVSTPMLLVMLLLVRHVGVLRPVQAAVLALLSAAGLSSAMVSLVHGHESAAMTLVWHGGAVLSLCALAALSGRPLLAWIGYVRR